MLSSVCLPPTIPLDMLTSKTTKAVLSVVQKTDERAKRFCVHLHALFCVDVSVMSNPNSSLRLESSSESVPQIQPTTSSDFNIPLHRTNTLKFQSSRRIPCDIPPELLRQIDERNRGVDLQWSTHFFTQKENCGLCGRPLGEAAKHSGSDGTAFLITSSVCFRKVEIRVKICPNTKCKLCVYKDK